MEGTAFLDAIDQYLQQEDALAISREVSDLRNSFEDYMIEEERKIQVEELEAQEQQVEIDLEDRKIAIQKLKEDFRERYNAFKEKRKQQKDAVDTIEAANLGQKRSLIAKLKDLVANEENIGAAFATLKEIQDTWKSIGDIPRAKRNEVETEYAHLMDDFFYNINIYKELKEHDFHRNEQLKEAIIKRLKQLNSLDKIKEIESQLKKLQDEWNDVGPVPNERWEALKESYWTEVRSIYNKINRFYEDRRSIQLDNLKKKEDLLAELKTIVAEVDQAESAKGWDKLTSKVLDIQERWKKVGFGPKKQNDELFAELRKVCDLFFDQKKAFFDVIKKDYEGVAKQKKALIDEAILIVQNEDKRSVADQLKKLQNTWKKLGHSGPRNEQKLWKEFRGVCDKFFTSLEEDKKKSQVQEEANLKAKKEVVAKIKSLKLPENKQEALRSLNEHVKEFNAIGHVPFKAKDSLFKEFKAAMDAHYASMKMDEQEKEQVLLEAQIEMIQGGSNAGRQLRGIKDEIRRKIDHYNKEIIQLENNLGFFSNSKGAEKLLKEVEGRVEGYKEKISQLKQQLKMIPNE